VKPIGQLDTSHPMYPHRRPKRLSAYERRQNELALRTIATIRNNGIVPDPHGSQAQKEAWMRERQSRIGSEREKLRMPHPPKEIQDRWIDEGEK
jgi:hypothetical protein